LRLLSISLAALLCAMRCGAAADLPSLKGAGVVDHDFGGAYAGLHVGGDWGGLVMASPSSSLAVGTDAVSGGVHLGYNAMFGHVVAGVETEIDGSSASKKFVFGGLPAAFSQNWFGSVDARLGWASGCAMVYGLAGYAWSVLEGRLGPADVSAVRNGYVVGGGLDYAFTERLSWRAEYRYYEFGSAAFAPPATARIADNVVRAGLTYRFSGAF